MVSRGSPDFVGSLPPLCRPALHMLPCICSTRLDFVFPPDFPMERLSFLDFATLWPSFFSSQDFSYVLPVFRVASRRRARLLALGIVHFAAVRDCRATRLEATFFLWTDHGRLSRLAPFSFRSLCRPFPPESVTEDATAE